MKLCQRDADITITEGWELVTAQREWRAALAEVKRARRPPSLLTLFNWLGLGWYLTVLASYALLEWQATSLPVWSRMTIATLMLLGHLYIWELRRRVKGEHPTRFANCSWVHFGRWSVRSWRSRLPSGKYGVEAMYASSIAIAAIALL